MDDLTQFEDLILDEALGDEIETLSEEDLRMLIGQVDLTDVD